MSDDTLRLHVPGTRANRARFVHQHDEEYDEVKRARRAGRPASAQEDLLRMKVEALEKEYRDGFCKLPFPLGTEYPR